MILIIHCIETVQEMTDKAFEICQEMINQRGYKCVSIDNDTYRISALKPDNNPILVMFHMDSKLDTKSVKDILEELSGMDIKHAIVVYKDSITAATKNIINIISTCYIEIFTEQDLQYNITKHILQPIYQRLPADEAMEFKDKYKEKISAILHDRPISRFYNYAKGDIIRVIRKHNYIDYRIVK